MKCILGSVTQTRNPICFAKKGNLLTCKRAKPVITIPFIIEIRSTHFLSQFHIQFETKKDY